MTAIELQDLTKRFGETTAVDGVSATIDDGETIGLVGPSGCGKTTTLRMIAGFETPTAGTVRFDGEDVTHVAPERRDVGLVFQSDALFANMTVMENVAFGPKVRGVGREDRRERAQELLELLDIGSLGDRDPATLSGGQRQRVGLARALAIRPRVLLLDEPMTGLDARLKRRLRTDLGRLLEELDVTAVYVTHDQEEAMTMCDRVAVMNDGRIEQIGTPETVYASPETAFVADFVGTSNLLEGVVGDGQVTVGDVTLPVSLNGAVPQGEPVTVLVRPEDVRVGEGSITATVESVFYTGDAYEVLVSIGDEAEITVTVDRREELAPGDTVAIDVRDARAVE